MKIALATKNSHKVQELNAMLGREKCQLLGLAELGVDVDWVEDGGDFRSNALIKAQAVARHCDLAVLADDSGLVVPALDGAPGVHTARYAGENASDVDNYTKLLVTMEQVNNRDAYFTCCLCFLAPGARPMFFEGRLEGEIARSASGQAGFGYDPVFRIPGRDQSLAELGDFEKNLISHRYHAMQKFIDFISL